MAKKTYKLNNKSELQSKSDSVVLTNYKNLDDNFFIEEKNQEIKDTISSGSIDQILIRENEMIKKLEDLKQLREKLETELKHSLEIYEMLEKIREAEKKEFEKVYKFGKKLEDLKQLREKFEDWENRCSEMYTKLEKLREMDRKEFKNASNSSQFEYDSLNEKESEEEKEI